MPNWPYVVDGWPGNACFVVFASTGPWGVSLDPIFLPAASVIVAFSAVADACLLQSGIVCKACGEDHTFGKAEAFPINCALFCDVWIFCYFCLFCVFCVAWTNCLCSHVLLV